MSEYKRWYEKNELIQKCVTSIEELPDTKKHQVATYLMDEIINKPPLVDMMAEDVYKMATSETRRRRWYDFDEVIRLFIELIRQVDEQTQKDIAIKSIKFVSDITIQPVKSIELQEPEENQYFKTGE